uniref:Ycf19 n=1 Tax=Cyanidium sp. THAL103 TaxID=3027999 RepID=A0A9Y1I455_9RHOD|nr:hypothetical protein CspTHAL103_142 [Cyanidium sp. THAL103]
MNQINYIFLQTVINFLHFYVILLILRITLAWFPSLNWYNQPFYTLSLCTDPYLRAFRGIIPSILGMDFSPILGLTLIEFFLEIIYNQINNI